MIKQLSILAALVLVGCGSDGAPGPAGKEGTPGVEGKQGQQGEDGQDGESFQAALDREIDSVPLGSVVDIECDTGRGTGTYTTEGLLTATHVLSGSKTCQLFQPGEDTPIHAWTPAASSTTDVVIETMTLSIPAAQVNRAWTPVRGVGFLMPNLPWDMWGDLNLSFGRVLTTALTEDFVKRQGGLLFPGAFAVDVVGFSGSSGSPLFVGGKVVAVFVAGYTNGNDVRFAEDLR